MAIEVWRLIPHWPEYEASTFGRIRRVKATRGTRAGKILKLRPHDGYWKVMLRRNATPRMAWVHRLVALTFFGSPLDARMEVCHNDNDGQNNRLENLRWDTRANNSADRVAARTDIRGEKNPGAVLTEGHVRAVRKMLSQGIRKTLIARQYQVSPSTVGDIARHRTWRHVI
ncbi:HNH endonuclease [Robbsia andropogonis]|uniref:HNH endonuclease n=1 Tax=Robbsia andropogonis TaxID=28092 RepID=UPI003D198190